MNQYQTIIHQLDTSDLTDRMIRLALALLARTADRGELHLSRADACAICQVEDSNTVAKYLARLAAAGLLDWKGGNGAFHIWWSAWAGASDFRPPAAKTTPPVAIASRRVAAGDQPPAAAKWTPWAANQPPAAKTTPPAAGEHLC